MSRSLQKVIRERNVKSSRRPVHLGGAWRNFGFVEMRTDIESFPEALKSVHALR